MIRLNRLFLVDPETMMCFMSYVSIPLGCWLIIPLLLLLFVSSQLCSGLGHFFLYHQASHCFLVIGV